MITLTKKINGTYRSKLKSRTPINIAIPKAFAENLKAIPRNSLLALATNKGTAKDWYNIAFRLTIGLEIAKEIYTSEASEAIKPLYETAISLMDRYIEEDLWYINKVEYEELLIGLEATDQMQDETTRRLQLDIFKYADAHVKKLIANGNQKYAKKYTEMTVDDLLKVKTILPEPDLDN